MSTPKISTLVPKQPNIPIIHQSNAEGDARILWSNLYRIREKIVDSEQLTNNAAMELSAEYIHLCIELKTLLHKSYDLLSAVDEAIIEAIS